LVAAVPPLRSDKLPAAPIGMTELQTDRASGPFDMAEAKRDESMGPCIGGWVWRRVSERDKRVELMQEWKPSQR